MSDVLLITPPSPKPTPWTLAHQLASEPILGVGYIAAVLHKNNFSCDISNYYLGIKEIEIFKKEILSRNPKIVGLTATTETYENSLILAKIIKEINPEIKIIIGGPHVTFTADETLKDLNIDIVVRGEGEYTMLEIANFFIHGEGSLEKIKGISYRNEEGIVIRNPSRPFIRDLDELPYPVRNFELLAGAKGVSVISSRGCPNRCIFCSAGAMSGGRHRMRRPEAILEEILYLQTKFEGLKRILFVDDTVTVDIPRLFRLCDLLEKTNINWSAESRVDVVDEEAKVFKRMAEAGCVGLQFGVESGSQEILDKIRKGTNLQQIEKAVRLARESNIEVFCSMMIGQVEDTCETVEQSVTFGEYLQSKYKVGVLFSITTPFPGTFMFNHPERLGIEIKFQSYNDLNLLNPVFDGKYLTAHERRNLFFDAINRIVESTPDSWRKRWKDAI